MTEAAQALPSWGSQSSGRWGAGDPGIPALPVARPRLERCPGGRWGGGRGEALVLSPQGRGATERFRAG